MRRLAVTLPLLLACCVHPAAETIAWHRAGTSEQETGEDLQGCKRASQSQVDREQTDQSFIDQYGQQTSLATSIDAYTREKRVDALTQDCMKVLGYLPAPKAPG
jgi:hypothetical protein